MPPSHAKRLHCDRNLRQRTSGTCPWGRASKLPPGMEPGALAGEAPPGPPMPPPACRGVLAHSQIGPPRAAGGGGATQRAPRTPCELLREAFETRLPEQALPDCTPTPSFPGDVLR